MIRSGKMSALAVAVVIAVGGTVVSGYAKPAASVKTYKLPDETAAFKPGPNLEVVQNNCTACHSADYVKTQPQGPKFKKDFWQAEVTKMIKVFGAPIDDADVPKIVDYLSQTY
jgi:cytochrome c5